MAAKKIGRPPLFGTPMTAAQHQARHRAKVAEQQRASAPATPGILDGDQLLALLGLDPAMLPVVPAPDLAALRAMPGGNDPFESDGDQPALDEFGEPIF